MGPGSLNEPQSITGMLISYPSVFTVSPECSSESVTGGILVPGGRATGLTSNLRPRSLFRNRFSWVLAVHSLRWSTSQWRGLLADVGLRLEGPIYVRVEMTQLSSNTCVNQQKTQTHGQTLQGGASSSSFRNTLHCSDVLLQVSSFYSHPSFSVAYISSFIVALVG